MKITNCLGEYAFKALVKNGNGWKLTQEYYFTQQEVMKFNEGYEVVWPVEENEVGGIYIPDQSEIE